MEKMGRFKQTVLEQLTSTCKKRNLYSDSYTFQKSSLTMAQ